MATDDIFLKIIKLGFLAASIDKKTVQEEVDIIKMWSLKYLSARNENGFNFNAQYNPNTSSRTQTSDYLKSIYRDLKQNDESFEVTLNDIKKSDVFENDFRINDVLLQYDILLFIISIIESDNKLTVEEANFIFNVKKIFSIDNKYYTDKVNKLVLNIKNIKNLDDIVENIYGLKYYTDNKKIISIVKSQYKFWNTLTTNQNRSFRNRAKELLTSLAQMRIKYNV